MADVDFYKAEIERQQDKYKELTADFMFIKCALDELVSAANVQLSDAWVDVSDGCGEDCTEFSLYQSAVPRLVRYLKQRDCCGP